MMNKKARVIAFYLPQYHPFRENDEWWGKGFTEWANVAKAKPLFKGHYQPKIPADLGFYDLRVPEVREEQARLAREAGIEGFCYWHYWFHGHELMERPFWEVVNSGKPDYPFCIGWANETWKSKMWNKDGSLAEGTKVLIEQTYSEEDDIVHFNKLLPVFKDHRYITVDGKPLVFIHRADDLPEHTIRCWKKLARENGLAGIHFVGRVLGQKKEHFSSSYDKLISKGYDALTPTQMAANSRNNSFILNIYKKIRSIVLFNGCMNVVDYDKEMSLWLDKNIDGKENIYPQIYPNWDHSPRSGSNTLILINSTPEIFKKYLFQFVSTIQNKSPEHQILFLKSWNEWGEGNYVEPDMKYGHGYLNAIKDVVLSEKTD